MSVFDRIFLGNLGIWGILLAPIYYPIVWIFQLIGWLRLPNKMKFCKHEWVSKKLPASYGVFGGMEIYTCRKCGKEDWNRNVEGRLNGSGLM